MHLPRIRSVPSVAAVTCWAALALQLHSWILLPLVVAPKLSSMHLPARPDLAGVVFATAAVAQRCAGLPLQSKIPSWVPSTVLLAGSSRHRPDAGLRSA